MAWLKCECIEHHPGPPSRYLAWLPGTTDNVLLNKIDVAFEVQNGDETTNWASPGKIAIECVEKGPARSTVRLPKRSGRGYTRIRVNNNCIEDELTLSRLVFTKFTEESNAARI